MSLKVFKWFCSKSKNILIPLILSIALNALLSVVGVRFALVSKNAIDVATGHAPGKLSEVFVVLGVLLTVQVCVLIFGGLLDARVRGKLEIKIKKDLFHKLLEKDWLSLTSYHSGELLNRLTSDVTVIISAITVIVPSFVSMIITLVMSAYYLFVLVPQFALCILPLGPIVLIIGRIYSRKTKALHKKCQECDGKTRSFMQETLQNVIAIKAFRAEASVSDSAGDLQLDAYKYKIFRNNLSVLAGSGIYVIFTCGYFVALGWGAYMISKGAFSYGTLVAMLRLVSQVQSPFRGMSSLLSMTFTSFASAERIIELEEMKDEKKVVDYSEICGKIDNVSLEKVTFSYKDNYKVIENANITIQKGEFIGIAGQSGIGKSTFLKLLLGLVSPDGGNMYIQYEDKKVPVGADTRSCFSYVPQENMILSGTIRDNIRFYNKQASDSEINMAAHVACVDDFVKELPNGLDTVLKEGGNGLSGGQIQRIAIARAILFNSQIILLDEATSALDEETEKKVLNNIKHMTDKSCVIVSHRPAALEICNKKVKIEDGKFVLLGSE